MPSSTKPRKAYTHHVKKRLRVRQVEREPFHAEIVGLLLEALTEMPASWRGALRTMELRDQRLSPSRIAAKIAEFSDPILTSETELHAAALEGRAWIQAAFIQTFGVVPYYQLRWAGRW